MIVFHRQLVCGATVISCRSILMGKIFTIQLIRLSANVNSPKLASKLFGEIEKQNDFETILRMKVRCSPGTYIYQTTARLRATANMNCVKAQIKNHFFMTLQNNSWVDTRFLFYLPMLLASPPTIILKRCRRVRQQQTCCSMDGVKTLVSKNP
jgi:hypothetical protein